MKRLLHFLIIVLILYFVSGCARGQGSDTPGGTDVSLPESTEETASLPADAEPERDKNGYIMITRAEDFELLRQYPEENFHVTEDIDFQGAEFEPIDGFQGTVSGLYGGVFNHTISNVKIKVKEGAEYAGFFSVLAGYVEKLNFENVTLELPDGFSGMAGILAGVVDSAPYYSGREHDPSEIALADLESIESITSMVNDIQILSSSISGRVSAPLVGLLCGCTAAAESCFVSGSISLEINGTGAFIGTVAGYAGRLDDVESDADLSLTGTADDLKAGGIAGELLYATKVIYGGHCSVELSGESSLIGGIAGILGLSEEVKNDPDNGLAGTAYASKEKLILTAYSSAKKLEIVVNGETLDQPFTGNGADDKIRAAFRRDISNLDETTLSEKERKLRETVVDYMIREVTIPWQPQKDMDFSDAHENHTQHYEAGEWYFGLPYTHKCGSLERSMQYLDDGVMKEAVPKTGWDGYLGNDCADAVYWAWARISPSITYTLTHDMIVQNGTLQVGEYELVNHEATADTCKANGITVMSEAYACLKMGDAVLYGPGHVRMVAEAPTVIRKADGSIDPDASYVLCHEQGSISGLSVRHTTCKYRYAYTFTNLFQKNYIPITIPEFAAGEAGEWIASVEEPNAGTYEGVFHGLVTSNYRIDAVRTVITNRETSETAIDYRYYPNNGKHISEFNLASFRGIAKVKALKDGDYHYVLYLMTGAGEKILEEYDFTKGK